MIGQHTDKVTAKVASIPEAKRKAKWRSTFVGLGAIAAGICFVVFDFPFPWWFNAGLLVFGGFCLSQDLVRAFFGFIPAAVKDIRAALRNGA